MSDIKNDLTVVTVVENDSGIINYLVDSVYAFTTPKPKIIICDNGRNGTLLDKYKDDKNITVVENPGCEFKGGSNIHGESLNKVLPMVTTGKTAIIESDCVVLSRDWNLLDTSKYKMSATIKPTKYGERHYYVCVMVFETGRLNKMDWRPGTDKTRAHNKSYIKQDCGWRIIENIKPHEVQPKTGNESVCRRSGVGECHCSKYRQNRSR